MANLKLLICMRRTEESVCNLSDDHVDSRDLLQSNY